MKTTTEEINISKLATLALSEMPAAARADAAAGKYDEVMTDKINRHIPTGLDDTDFCDVAQELRWSITRMASAMNPTHEKQAGHTAGPWAIMSDPVNAGKHPFHDSRWIVTQGTVPDLGGYDRSWSVEGGELICEMRDGPAANARLIAASPCLLAALRAVVFAVDQGAIEIRNEMARSACRHARAAIARTEGSA